jgi:signal transduction histidine kinase
MGVKSALMSDRGKSPARPGGFGPQLFVGGGEVRALMRARNWSETPLGSPELWPSSLRAVVQVMLTSRFAMWMAWGPELTFLCNDAYLPTVGIKRDWVIGSRSDRVWAEIWPDIGPRIQHVLTTGEATWDEALLLYLERSGFSEETYHTFSYSPLSDDTGATQGMLCVVAEVTNRVIGERQLATLRDLGARLASASARSQAMKALENCLASEPRDLPFALAYLAGEDPTVFDLVAMHGLNRNVSAIARRFAVDDPRALWPLPPAMGGEPKLIEVPPSVVSGFSLNHWQHPPAQALACPIRSADEGAPVGYLIAGLNPHRAFEAEYRGFVELLTAQVAAAIARTDEYERARERAEALAEIDRAKTAFFSNVSHEFRTPLTLMLGPLEDAIADSQSAPPELLERLDIAHRNALRLLRLVNSLLDFSRIEAGRLQLTFRPSNLAALTAELASSFRSATDRAGLGLYVDAQPLSAPVYIDRDMWEKIVLNLISNAFKFTFEGEISVELREEGDIARLKVRDTGVGIPKAELPKLFDRFHRVEGARGRSFEGSGIGLALVQELVKQHGGEISVESEMGRGSIFTVSIPFGRSHLPPERVEEASNEAPITVVQAYVEEALRWLPGGAGGDVLFDSALPSAQAPGLSTLGRSEGRRILLADDNADLRSYIGRLLTERGHEVEAVVDGVEALHSARARRPDLLITDVMMPRLDGFSLLRALRADPELRDLPVIVLSARAGEEAKVEGLDAGADDYLIKPFSARELLARTSTVTAMASLRREAREAVRASEALAREQAERVQLALDAGAIIGTWVWEVQKDRFVSDERFARSFDLDPELCRGGLPLEDVMAAIHEEDRAHVETMLADALKRGGAYRAEYRVRQPDGSFRWVEANGRVDFDSDETPVRFPGVLIDIDHRRQIEAELRELNDELETRVAKAVAAREAAEDALRHAQKMEAVGQLTGGIAHDFNNLLTVITGNVDTARRALASGETGRVSRSMENAQKGAERAAALTQRLLAFSRRQPLTPRSINADRLVTGMADLLHRTLGETVRLETISTPGLWPVEADPNQLENTILNLAVNARDAMPDGGRLTIETANVWLDEQYASAQAEVTPGGYVAISVTDTGQGMSKDVAARAFDPYFTTKEVGKGTGLGLSMVYGFVKQSGGHVKIYSEPGEGTTVKIYLPRFMSGREEEEHAPVAEPDRTPRGRTILVVEDDEDVRIYTVDMLRELGYRVLHAPDGVAALRMIEREEREIDLLFTDVVMPNMSGRALADHARALQPDLKVLYTSGYTRNAIVHGGRLDAGVEMIAKPFTYQSLAQRISDTLDAGRTGRLLVAESDPTLRMFAIEVLKAAGFSVDEAATAFETLSRVRAARGRYDAVIFEEALPEMMGPALAIELRAMHADLPLMIASEERADEIRTNFLNDRFAVVVTKPYNASKLLSALNALGVRRR